MKTQIREKNNLNLTYLNPKELEQVKGGFRTKITLVDNVGDRFTDFMKPIGEPLFQKPPLSNVSEALYSLLPSSDN